MLILSAEEQKIHRQLYPKQTVSLIAGSRLPSTSASHNAELGSKNLPSNPRL